MSIISADEFMLRAQLEEERAKIKALQEQLTEVTEERDHNLLVSGDISCMETDKPGCGYCNGCLRTQLEYVTAQRDTAEQRAQSAEAACAAMREALDAVVIRLSVSNAGSEEALQRLRSALAPDAGQAILERLRTAESRVAELEAKHGK